jgi:hypothetical protein
MPELLEGSSVHVVTVMGRGSTAAVGATLVLDVKIEGVGVTAMVDTGSQSSIISKSCFTQLKQQGRHLPQYQPALVRLFGKDGKAGKHELGVTAFQVEADGISIPVLLFVQPDSSQPCWLHQLLVFLFLMLRGSH